MKTEVKMVRIDDGSIGWKLLDDAGLEWHEVLEDVCRQAANELEPGDLNRWNDACGLGLGPHADADIDGVRWVVPGMSEYEKNAPLARQLTKELALIVGDDGTGTLRVHVDAAIANGCSLEMEDLAAAWNEAGSRKEK